MKLSLCFYSLRSITESSTNSVTKTAPLNFAIIPKTVTKRRTATKKQTAVLAQGIDSLNKFNEFHFQGSGLCLLVSEDDERAEVDKTTNSTANQ